jgi:hypothetical protein
VKPLLLVLALVSPIFAAATDAPEKEALRFVEKLRDKKLDLEPGHDTALSPATGNDKRKLIEERINHIRSEMSQGELEIGPGTVDGDMAAVLVRQMTGFDPSRLRVIAIGLVLKGDRWLAAPVPGSFENTGLGYDVTIRKRLTTLESWMMREQLIDLTHLREKSAERLHTAISQKIKPEELRDSSPELLTKRLLTACEKHDQASVLGLIGGLQAELPKDWEARVSAVDAGFLSTSGPSPWKLLATPSVIRTIAKLPPQGDDHAANLDLACLDSPIATGATAAPSIQIFGLKFSRSEEGLWRIDLPEIFYAISAHEQDQKKEVIVDDTVLNSLPEAWRRDHPASHLDRAKSALEALVNGLHAESPAEMIQMLSLDGDPATARRGLTRLATAWQDHHRADPGTLLLLGFHEVGDSAVAAFQFFSSREPDRTDLRKFFFSRTDGAWFLTSGLRPTEPAGDDLRAVQAWVDAQAPEWSKNWETLALSTSPELTAVPTGEAPTEAQARATFESWSTAILKGDVQAAITFTTHLSTERSPARLMQNLGHELISARRCGQHASVLGILRKGSWAAVSCRIGEAGEATTTYPLYPLVQTPAGPRVLGEIDLFANGGRTRDFLNDSTWSRLQAANDGEAAASLREIYEIHRTSAEADRPPTRP